MVGFSFGHSLGLSALSPLVGMSYDAIGFPHTYLLLAALGLVFWVISIWALEPTPAEFRPPAKTSKDAQPIGSAR
jgi:OHS family lactose permease-like MFS transporter